MKWFQSCKCIEDVKTIYHQLIKLWHPDICTASNATATMAQINSEYETAFERWKNTHRTIDTETHKEKYYEKATDETPAEYRDILEHLIHYPGILIEIIGSWIWITGETKPIKEELKQLRFAFSPKKVAWYFHSEPFRKSSKRDFAMDDLRNFWGSQVVEQQRREQLI